MTASEVTDLPDPLSPTMPSVCPASSAKPMPCSACTVPCRVEKLTRRSSTRSSAVIVRIRGSRMSRSPSPSRLKHSTVSISARPGNATSHHLPVVMKRAPSATMMPHSGVGACTPRPMKDSPAAFRIAQPRLSEICTAIAGSTFGSRKRSTTDRWPSPQARAASTQPALRRTFTSARAKRM